MLTEREFREAVERHRDTVFRVAFAYMRGAADARGARGFGPQPVPPGPAAAAPHEAGAGMPCEHPGARRARPGFPGRPDPRFRVPGDGVSPGYTVMPPSTWSTSPVTYAARSLAR